MHTYLYIQLGKLKLVIFFSHQTPFEKDFQINVTGAINSLKNVLGNLSASGNASIVFFSTVAVQTGMPFHSSVAASKGAIEGLTRSLAAEFAPKIRVNAIAPGPVIKNKRQTEKHFNKQSKNTLLGKTVKIEDICKTAYLLANSETITGQIIAVDSGQSLNWKTPDMIGINE